MEEVVERVTVALPSAAPPRLERVIAVVAAELERRGVAVATLMVPSRGLPASVPAEVGRLAAGFAATPGALVESWRVARHLEESTAPGNVVLLTDHRGFGGVFALEQTSAVPEQRRHVWTLAGNGLALERLVVAGTVEGADAEEAATIDWELVQYRTSEVVLTLGDTTRALVAACGGDATRLTVATGEPPDRSPISATVIQLPERVSRRSQTPRMLRAVAGVLEEHPTVTVFASTNDAPDLVWSGTTWEAAESVLRPFDDRVRRTRDILTGAVLVLGDVLAAPNADVVAAHRAGATMLVPEGSVAAALWPDASTWSDTDELAEALNRVISGTTDPPRAPLPIQPLPEPAALVASDRASRVSVGVPVYRDVGFLDECVESILGQTEPPHEIILLDDGSNSREVDARLDRWVGERPGLIRVMRQPNRGVCVARNTMLEAMSGDTFLLVDQDDTLDPEFISRCGQALRNDPALWAVATWTEFVGSYEAVEAKPPFDDRVARRENPIVSTAALVDMRVRDAGIRFAPDLAFIYCEDWHVWSQIVAAGGRIGLVPEPLVKHRVHTSSGGFRRTELAMRIGKARAIEPLLGAPKSDRLPRAGQGETAGGR
jgi:GT2 family glycosyltransferase